MYNRTKVGRGQRKWGTEMRAEDKQSAHFLLQMTKENAFEVALS
jgi:hypothetical protein